MEYRQIPALSKKNSSLWTSSQGAIELSCINTVKEGNIAHLVGSAIHSKKE